jgi:hypothetical protein
MLDLALTHILVSASHLAGGLQRAIAGKHAAMPVVEAQGSAMVPVPILGATPMLRNGRGPDH